MLDPRAVPPALVLMLRQGYWWNRGQNPVANLHPTGGHLGLPADFLIGSDGRVIACKYGMHADDQWSVDELLAQLR